MALARGRPATTTPADRRRVARLLLEKVFVTVEKASERVDVVLHWVGGAVRPHALARPVMRYSQQSDYPRLVERLRRLCAVRLTSAAIAAASAPSRSALTCVTSARACPSRTWAASSPCCFRTRVANVWRSWFGCQWATPALTAACFTACA